MALTQRTTLIASLVAVALSLMAQTAQAQIKIGVIISATGPAASLGIPQKNTVSLLPTTIGGKSVEYIVLDDNSDTTAAVKNTRRLASENVDAIIGSSITPNSLAMVDVVAETQTPMISVAASAKIIEPMDDKHAWVFKTPQNDSLMASAVVERMVVDKIATVAYIGFSDSYGQGWYSEFAKQTELHKLKIVANEGYNRNDTSVTGQILKIIAANPDAVLIGAAGTPAVLPQRTLRERGYKGKIYQTHGVANNDFLRLGGKDVEGTLLPAGPVLVAALLPDSNPSKKTGLDYTQKYEAAYGAGSVTTFGAHLWDAGLLLQRALPEALKVAKPGTKEFRKALRDAIENVKNLTVSHGVINMTKTDHSGLDNRARVMVKIEANHWALAQ
ncbi:ABC transporter substrate-binding protein [Herbaspirillum sp. RTI4]|uniref:ABC transporter substrate-binding protein n=1 Tax=Herbaspirillum sp. RTI4 TaxID=3048640 RepID=UPI002AB57A82|nr:ABC transporter substrate-binding protein [Herbaspirillum sp. RTI4]MDY7579970.1 ABC transporter substrate-binding protein [Herbaspirillum sp. RTI4]MEA9982886.1 ABC transporter substrate-binding protein [Herbaspirillum sp. RTI4]